MEIFNLFLEATIFEPISHLNFLSNWVDYKWRLGSLDHDYNTIEKRFFKMTDAIQGLVSEAKKNRFSSIGDNLTDDGKVTQSFTVIL